MSEISDSYKSVWQHIGTLSTCYNERYRHYHDIRHVHFLINKITDTNWHKNAILPQYQLYFTSQFLQDLMEVAWFHDAYYDPYAIADNNEFLSAQLYWTMIGNKSKPEVYDAILATAHHLQDQENLTVLAKVFLDLDLLGFYYDFPGTDEDVRKEYWRTSDEEYLKNRRAFLSKLLKRDRIFYTLNEDYEIQTRINILNKLR